eukprot:7056688-Prymnesium_polylepis.1
MDPSRAPPGSGTNLNTFNTTPDDSSPAHHNGWARRTHTHLRRGWRARCRNSSDTSGDRGGEHGGDDDAHGRPTAR